MKVAVFPADKVASGYYRMRLPGEALQARGMEITFDLPLSGYWDSDGRITGVEPLDCDIVVLQRPLHRDIVDGIPFIQEQGIAVVADMDDDFTCIHPMNSTYKSHHPASSPNSNWNHLKRALSLVDGVTVSTPALAERYGRGKAVVIRNALDRKVVESPVDEVVPNSVGWAGTVLTHPTDLQVTNGQVARFCAEFDYDFLVIGDGGGVEKNLNLKKTPLATGIMNYESYMRALGTFELGIVPLAINKFNLAKSFLKGIEYASRKIPFVATSTPEYELLASQGIGRTAEKPKDWYKNLKLYETYPYLAAGDSHEAYEAVLEHHLIEHRLDQWASAWEDALRRRRG